MKRRIGTIFLVMGASLIFAAVSLFLYNQYDSARAARSAAAVMERLMEKIPLDGAQTLQENAAAQMQDSPAGQMTVVQIYGDGYIGCLSVPSLGLELPVMADWSYPKLKTAPCRYAGSVDGNDLVVMAHNYPRHFGRLSELEPGAEVVFTDLDGGVTRYQVAGLDVLAPTSVEAMTAGKYDLTLFTCTYGGKSRVTVYCSRTENG